MAFRNAFSRLPCRALYSASRQALPLFSAARVSLVNTNTIVPAVSQSCKIHTNVPLFNENIINIQDEADFQKRVLDSGTPVVVDFHAE